MNYRLLLGSALEKLKTLEPNSVDAIVTDPPYGLNFMGKEWDKTVPDKALWKESFRVAKPGAYLLAFGGTRTHHHLMVALEDAGWEIRDCIMWVYGSGFPKSHNVSKAVEATIKHGGSNSARLKKTELEGDGRPYTMSGVDNGIMGDKVVRERKTWAPEEGHAKDWDGWGTALKPAWEPIILARKPLKYTVAKNVLEHGTGALNIKGCLVGDEPITSHEQGNATNMYGGGFSGEVDGRKRIGRWPANLVHDGSPEVIDLFPNADGGAYPDKRGSAAATSFGSGQATEGGARQIADKGSAARFFYCAKASKHDRDEGLDCPEQPTVAFATGNGASGNPSSLSAGRTTSRKNNHPTVKPVNLMRHLCRLITPKGGTILDPFMGSGSTGKAAMLEGFSFVGIDMEQEYYEIASKRIEYFYTLQKEIDC